MLINELITLMISYIELSKTIQVNPNDYKLLQSIQDSIEVIKQNLSTNLINFNLLFTA